jgi:two-component system, NarL family, nitrate/nitrite response regulator NarL
MSRLLIIDDHPLIREGMIAAISRLLPGVEVFGAGSAEDGLSMLDIDPDIDLVLIDIGLPGIDGFAALQQFSTLHPTISRMIMTASDSAYDQCRAIAAGASGYLHKSMLIDDVIIAIETVMMGGVYRHQYHHTQPKCDSVALTIRQLDVLQLLTEGCTNKQIARTLQITERTAKAHVAAIFLALGAANRTQAVIEAQRQGYAHSKGRAQTASTPSDAN